MRAENEARNINSLGLKDCGKVVKIYNPDFHGGSIMYEAEIQMVIKAPKGTLAIYTSSKYIEGDIDAQCEAIRTFVDMHTPHGKNILVGNKCIGDTENSAGIRL